MLYKHVSGEPAPPPSVSVDADGLSLVATWSEPFSLTGEQLSYVVSITNIATRAQEEVAVNTTRFILSEPIGERDCAEYQFTVFSRNSFSRSQIGVTERIHIPTSNYDVKCVHVMYTPVCVCVWTTVYCGLCLSLLSYSFGTFLFLCATVGHVVDLIVLIALSCFWFEVSVIWPQWLGWSCNVV